MSASEILIKPQAEEEQYTQSHQHHHDTASGLVFDPVAQTTMAGVVYHHHAPTESVAYANAAELVGAAAASVAAAAVEIAAMDGYGNNYSKRTLDDSTTGQEDSKRRRTLDLLDASKKVASEHWDSMFERLKAFKAQHGHCLVPKRYAADPKLGTWVETQRVQYKRLARTTDEALGVEMIQPNKRLSAERLKKLESLSFAWSAKHVRKNQKKPDAPQNVEEEANPSSQQNQQHQRRKRLNEAQWEDMYQRLQKYKEQYGNCLVPRKFDEDPKLSTWVETQRHLWNRDFRKQEVPSPTQDVPESFVSVDEQLPPEIAALGATNDFFMEDTKIKRLTPERKLKLDQLGFVWSLRSKRTEDHWDEMFKQLVEYKSIHGDCLVPSRYETNLKLGKWVETQRYEYTKLQRAATDTADTKSDTSEGAGIDHATSANLTTEPNKARPSNPRLTEDRLKRLESIGFEWRVKHKMKRYYDKQWECMFRKLMEFKRSNGHCMVPKRFPPDMKLGTWVHTQRIQYRKLMTGKKDTVEGIESVLNSSDPQLDADTRQNSAEDEMPTMNSAEDEVNYRLTDERRMRLEKAGFVWSAKEGEKGSEAGQIIRNSYDDQWDCMFEKLKEYKEKYGDCLVPKRYQESPKLGTWVDTQRVQFKKLQKKLASQGNNSEGETQDYCDQGQDSGGESPGKTGMSSRPLVGRLTGERVKRLQALGFVWSLRDDWQKHYDELKAFKKEHGHCNVPARYTSNRRLGIWVSAQRQQHKILRQVQDSAKPRRSAPLTQERIELLNLIGFAWTIRSRDTLGESWNQRLLELKAFKAQHGHCLVPSRYHANPELGIWVGTQRTQYRLYLKAKETGTAVVGSPAMNEERIRELQELGFVWALRGGEGRKDEFPLEVAAAEAAAAVEAADEVGAIGIVGI